MVRVAYTQINRHQVGVLKFRLLKLRAIDFKHRLEYIRDAFLGEVYSTVNNGHSYNHLSLLTSTSGVQVYARPKQLARLTGDNRSCPGKAVTDATISWLAATTTNTLPSPPPNTAERAAEVVKERIKKGAKRQPQFHTFTTILLFDEKGLIIVL